MVLRKAKIPILLHVHRIWDEAPHNALTDLLYFKDQFLCVFRESDQHVGGQDGVIRLIRSPNGVEWKAHALFAEKGVDLRDPKLSVTPDGRLMLLMGGSIYHKGQYVSRQPRVAFSTDSLHWSPLQPILFPHEWLWRITWHQGKGFGISYSFLDPSDRGLGTVAKLFMTDDGLHYDLVTHLNIPGNPSEGTLQFLSHGQIIGLFRRDKYGNNDAWVGMSYFPFLSWRWKVAHYHVGGPNFIVLPNDQMWAAGRILNLTPYGVLGKMALMRFNFDVLEPLLILPSGGDTGYPGLVYQDEILWMSYYSSHEEKTAIYLAQIQLPT